MSPTIARRARRACRPFSRRAVLRLAGGLVSLVLVAAGLQAAGAAPALAAGGGKGLTSGPVSNAFAMGGGVGGSIDQRTGAFQVSVPLVSVTGPAGTGLSLALSYDQSLAALGAAGDRFGLGAGWTLGVPWVDTAGGVHVYPASGGAYAYDASQPTGLAGYPLRDLTFAKDPGTTTPPPGVPARPYLYSLTTLDGTTDRFDANGNLIEQTDRFGNAIDLTWQPSGSSWQPTSVTDSYGQVTKFGYAAGAVTVTAPPNAEGITATTTLHLDAGRLTGVTDALGQTTGFGYAQVTGQPAELLSSVTSPAGEHTNVRYATPLAREPDLAAVSTVDVTDADGHLVLPELSFNISPNGDSQHNYTGYPDYNQNGPNGLFDSGDSGYRYTTALSNGTSTVDATYNSLHLLIDQQVYLHPAGGAQTLDEEQTYTYPCTPENPCSPASLPANYAKPTAVKVVYGDPQFGATRTVTTTAAYNDLGEQTSATDPGGTTTTTSYGSYGLPVKQTVTGKDGATSITTNTLTSDGKSIQTATTATGATANTATARTVTTYSYNGSGQVTGQSLAWAPGAKPAGNSGGPDQIDTTRQISTDPGKHTQTTVVTTAAGTPDAASTTTVSDLVTGEVLRRTDPSGLTTSYAYDALGRQTAVTVPGGQTTKTVYNSPTQTTVTAPSGLVTQTTTDVTGRTVKVTDNVSGQKLVADPAARTVQTDSYSPDGATVTSTGLSGQPTVTTLDPLGRPVKVVGPGGITQDTSYDAAANTQATSLIPAGGGPADAVSATVQGFDNLNRPVSSATSYADGTPKVAAAQSYDGLGRVTSASAAGVTVTPSYAGAGGLQDKATLTPTDTGSFPGDPVTAATSNTMTGAPTLKTLTQAGQPAPGSSYTYDDAGRVATVTTPAGAKTSYTYTPDGQIATITQPSGTATTNHYDPTTGRLAETDVTSPDGRTQKTAYSYDPATGLVTAVYNPDDPADKISYEHDADGHVTAVHYPDGTTVSASYTDTGQLATSTDITGTITTYGYNQAGKLTCATQTRSGATLAAVAYTYDSLDRVATVTRGDQACAGGGGITTTLAYTDASQVKTETTTDGTVLLSDSYTYDAHGNLASATTAAATPATQGRARPGRRAAATATTTTYSYDAYNRLTGSATYPGTTATGTPTSQTSYTLNAAGDVTKKATTSNGITTTTTNTIAPGDQLTSQTTGGSTASQAYDADGNVTRDLAGNTYTYTPAGQVASVTTPSGATTSYAYWPNRTLRSATTAAAGTTHTTTFHYNTAGQIINDTYIDGTSPAVTGSYLIGLGREARALIPAAGPAVTTGPGTGYYLIDPHGSVQAMVDPAGQVTASYQYSDYGIASAAALPAPRRGATAQAAVNPFGYDGAYTSPDTGTQYLPARIYDPAQGRFLSLDSAAQINRYQAFDTNPVNFTDPTGQYAVSDLITDIFLAVVFAVAIVASAGVASAAVGAVAAAVAAGEEVTAAAVAGAVLTTASTLANAGAAAASAVLAADDAAGLSGHNFLSAGQRGSLRVSQISLGFIGAVTGVAGGLAAAPAAADEGEAAADIAYKRFAIQPGDLSTGAGIPSGSSTVSWDFPVESDVESSLPSESEGSVLDTEPATDLAAAMRQGDLYEAAPSGTEESTGNVSEEPPPDTQVPTRTGPVNPDNTAWSESNPEDLSTGQPMTEAGLMLQDPEEWEPGVLQDGGWRPDAAYVAQGDDAESEASLWGDDAASDSEFGDISSMEGSTPGLTQSVESDVALTLNSNG